MGLDLHWRNKPRSFTDANADPSTGTWYSINVSGTMFYRGALSTLSLGSAEAPGTFFQTNPFPYDLEEEKGHKGKALKAAWRKTLDRLEELLTLPDNDPRMLEWQKACLGKDYSWREAIQNMLTYLQRAFRKGGGIVVY